MRQSESLDLSFGLSLFDLPVQPVKSNHAILLQEHTFSGSDKACLCPAEFRPLIFVNFQGAH
jgi:hypothetical protein